MKQIGLAFDLRIGIVVLPHAGRVGSARLAARRSRKPRRRWQSASSRSGTTGSDVWHPNRPRLSSRPLYVVPRVFVPVCRSVWVCGPRGRCWWQRRC